MGKEGWAHIRINISVHIWGWEWDLHRFGVYLGSTHKIVGRELNQRKTKSEKYLQSEDKYGGTDDWQESLASQRKVSSEGRWGARVSRTEKTRSPLANANEELRKMSRETCLSGISMRPILMEWLGYEASWNEAEEKNVRECRDNYTMICGHERGWKKWVVEITE